MNKKFFIKLILILFVLFIILIFNCTMMNENSIEGNWELTTVQNTQSRDWDNLRYNFKNGTISFTDSDQNKNITFNYSMSNNLIKINGSLVTETILANEWYNVYYFNNQMIWYHNATGLESYRFIKN